MNDQHDGRYRASVRIGSTVEIVRKQDQGTGKKMQGVVAEILTSASFHPRGIKVRLRDGKVGRVVGVIKEEGQE